MGSLYVVPCLHPANLFHGNRRWRGLMEHAFKRAAGLANNTWHPKWDDDNYCLRPTLEDVRAFRRASKGKRVSFDIETDGRHPLICDVRCIGLFNGQRGICIPLLWRDGSTHIIEKVSAKGKVTKRTHRNWVKFYAPDVEAAILKELQGLLGDPSTDCTTQNGQFDRLCVKARLGLRVLPGFDTMIAHHVVASFLSHALSMLTALYTESTYYKTTEEGDAWSSETDEELWVYCIRDCKITWIASYTLDSELDERPQDRPIYEHDRRMEVLCQGWKERGMLVDQHALGLLQFLYKQRAEEALRRLRETVGQALKPDALAELVDTFKLHEEDPTTGILKPVLRPRSLPELRRALDALHIPLTALTDTGEISTAKDYLLEARMELLEARVKATDPRIAFLDYLFAFRENDKIENTFLHPEILDDMRLHPTFSVHVVPTGRLSSHGPNFTNQPKEIRGIYIAKDGHLLVAGDWDSGELRLGGLLSNEPILLKAFDDYDFHGGPKIHKINAYSIFRVNEKTLTDPIYRAAKAFIYGAFYGAGVKTSYEACQKEMPDLLFSDFKRIYLHTVETYKVFFQWQKELVKLTSRRQYMDSPILERRRYFFESAAEDSPEAAAMMNMPFQSGLADLVELANFYVIDQLEAKYRKRGWSVEEAQLAQIHDELLFEVPGRDAQEFAADFKRVAEASTRRFRPKWHMPVDVKVSHRWAPLPWEKKKDEDAATHAVRLKREFPSEFLQRLAA